MGSTTDVVNLKPFSREKIAGSLDLEEAFEVSLPLEA
jgi:hypothetical protein